MIARSQGDVDLLEFLTWVQHMAATPTGVSASMVWFYKEQAAQGNSAAILNLAICNLSGVGMLQNAEEGVRLLKDAAGRGNAMAVRGGGSTQSHTRTRADLLCSASPDTARRECRRLCLTRLVSGCTLCCCCRRTLSVCAFGWGKVRLWTWKRQRYGLLSQQTRVWLWQLRASSCSYRSRPGRLEYSRCYNRTTMEKAS